MKYIIFLLAVFPAFADVTVSWTEQPTTGFTIQENRVYRWNYGDDVVTAVEIGSIPSPQNQLVITDHPNGIFNYCAKTFAIWVFTGEVIASDCSETVSAVIVNGKKNDGTPLAPVGVRVE